MWSIVQCSVALFIDLQHTGRGFGSGRGCRSQAAMESNPNKMYFILFDFYKKADSEMKHSY